MGVEIGQAICVHDEGYNGNEKELTRSISRKCRPPTKCNANYKNKKKNIWEQEEADEHGGGGRRRRRKEVSPYNYKLSCSFCKKLMRRRLKPKLGGGGGAALVSSIASLCSG
jgi:hypothetical protein